MGNTYKITYSQLRRTSESEIFIALTYFIEIVTQEASTWQAAQRFFLARKGRNYDLFELIKVLNLFTFLLPE